jgi:hypothetical protein
MPPQVNPAGCVPIRNQAPSGAEEINQCEPEKKQAEPQKESAAANTTAPHRATPKEVSHKKAEMKASSTTQQIKLNQQLNEKNKAESGKTKITESEQKMWDETVKKANAQITAGLEQAQAIAANHAIREQEVQKLYKKEYKQDIVPDGYFEVEKITPGTTNKTKTTDRVEDRSRGDVASRHYHPEQHRTSTQSGLEDRLTELNQGNGLTSFEKGLVSQWDPQKKEGGITALTPIKGMNSTGTKGPVEVQAYKIERGLETTYYDRNGNAIKPETDKQKMMKLAQRQHPQDVVRGELFEVEEIRPGSTDKIKIREHAEDLSFKDMVKHNLHPSQTRTSTQSGLHERLTELNNRKELTQFEKGLVAEWDPKMKSNGQREPIESLSPIKGLDSSGKKGSTEVEGYKVIRGGSGNQQTTYYDRNGNELVYRQKGGEAIPTDGPGDYLSLAYAGTKFLGKKALQLGEKMFAKEAVNAEKAAIVSSVEEQAIKAQTRVESRPAGQKAIDVETNATTRSAEQHVAKSETGAATRTADDQIAKSETEKSAETIKGSTSGKSADAETIRPNVMKNQSRTHAEGVARERVRTQQRKVDEALGQLQPEDLDVLRDTLEKAGRIDPAKTRRGPIGQVREALKNALRDNELPEEAQTLIGDDIRKEVGTLVDLEHEVWRRRRAAKWQK